MRGEEVEKIQTAGQKEGQASSSFEASNKSHECFQGFTVRHRKSGVAIA